MFEESDLLALDRIPAVREWHSVPPKATPIALQAMEIAASILEDPAPGLGDIKRRLRRSLAEHPGHPERALLAHLMETSARVNQEGGEGPP